MTLMERIHTGRRHSPPRLLIYGTEGIGKSTTAAGAPSPIFIPTEDGLDQIECSSFPLASKLADVEAALQSLLHEEHDFGTVVLDSADWLERLIWDVLCEQYGVTSIEKVDGGYAKGYTHALADILNIAGENGDVSKNHLATLRAMLGGFVNPPVLSPSEASEALRRHHDAIRFAVANLPTVTSARGVNTAITRAVVARAYYSVDRAMLKDFCRKLTTGIVTSGDEGIVVLLRQHLQENRGGSYSQRMLRYGKVQRVLSAWLKAENPSRIYPASVEQFPLPEEVKA